MATFCEICKLEFQKEDMINDDDEFFCSVCYDKLDRRVISHEPGIACPKLNCINTAQNPKTMLKHARRLHGSKLEICGKSNMKKHRKQGHYNNYFKYKGDWYQHAELTKRLEAERAAEKNG